MVLLHQCRPYGTKDRKPPVPSRRLSFSHIAWNRQAAIACSPPITASYRFSKSHQPYRPRQPAIAAGSRHLPSSGNRVRQQKL